MDFFSAVPSAPLSVAADEGDDPFARAIRDRFSSVHGGLLTAKLPTPSSTPSALFIPPTVPLQSLSLTSSPTTVTSTHPPPRTPRLPIPASPSATLPTSSSDAEFSSIFPPTLPQDLPALISLPGTLLIDIRPPSAFDAKRIVSATSLSVPSTLLKRPQFTLDKLAAMIPSKRSMERFLTWPAAERIIIIDADSSALSSTSNLLALLRKIRTASFGGHLTWVKGGFHAVLRASSSIPELMEIITASPQAIDDSVASNNSLPRTCDLPHSAFEQSSTTIASHRTPALSAPVAYLKEAAPGPSSNRVVAANPFYDNIRQLTELSGGVTERIPFNLDPKVARRASELPFRWLRKIANGSPTENAEALAMQFYKVELAEQRRLMGIMQEHSRQSKLEDFPFSITAGLEKGSKNRYQNIWPFEHARVRLNRKDRDGSDYVNASFVQPPGTKKRYIATQGPLADTLADFWSLVWEQNVHVIVMLTKRYEGSSVKCETYWPTELHSERQFGHYVVKATSSSMAASEQDAARPANEGFDFGQAATEPSGNDIAKRTFLLTNLLQPEAPARDITHFQYLEWPDLGVPIDPEGFLNLIDQVNQASEHAQDAPTILHCSAGVGRTGGYILVDAVLDGIRRAMRIERADLSSQESAVEMDVDETSSPEERPFLQPRKRLPSAPAASAPSSARPVFPSQRAVLPESSSWPTSSIPVPRSSSPRKTKRPMVSRRRISERIKARDGAIDPSSLSGISSEESHADTQDRSSFGASASASLSSGQSGQSDPSTPSTVPTSVPGTPPQRKTNPLTAPAFDFMPPRTPQHELNPLLPLQTMSEPVRQVLEGMREQRMSLCQTLRQYVFAHTAIIQGAVRMLDEPEFSSRGSSDTTLDTPMEGINLSKRPSTKRRHRSDSSPEEFPSKSVVHHRAVGFSRDMEDYM